MIGDVNHDGLFDNRDLLQVFAAGKYEDSTLNNASFDEGDWNGDGDFTTGDLVLAFQLGHYVDDAAPAARHVASLFAGPVDHRERLRRESLDDAMLPVDQLDALYAQLGDQEGLQTRRRMS